MDVENIKSLQVRVQRELVEGLTPFWQTQVLDYQNGGFIGRMENDRTIDRRAVKGLILNTRLLWTYSALYQFLGEDSLSTLAHRAFNYLVDHFVDPENGGAFWMLDYQGNPVDDKKKIYGQAFFIYALAEYYKIVQEKQLLDLATHFFDMIEGYAFDSKNGGYFEAFERDWDLAEDLRLGAADMNEKKSMNTHLHLLEAYTNLFRVLKHKSLEQKLAEMIKIFTSFIIDPDSFHFRLYFDEEWQPKSNLLSFGHDIEGSWLLYEAAEVLGMNELEIKIKEYSINMANAVLQRGIDRDGGLFYEANASDIVDTDKHWWPQAEAVVGFLNAFEISQDIKFLNAAIKSWNFIEKHIIDKKNGEWFWRVSKERKPYQNAPKVSEWKSPYHNCRACLEILRRTEKILKSQNLE
ncbi:N-acyl-D-glucosamine 2-epimerase [candidate division KSB1 bacterium]|nr:AGE family epimerase/isomerase [candidate division KSB1 bacterium]RQW00015.1 MAG: N-acyl-D-glucosamine 2-epimerase [candidate division KSB1 bacterium]